MKRPFLFFTVILICNNIISQVDNVVQLQINHEDSIKSVKIWTDTIGQFNITSHGSIDVIAKVDKVKYLGQGIDYPDADVSVNITNTDGKLLYIRNLHSSNMEVSSISSIELNGIGKVLVIIYFFFPCDNGVCNEMQILGFNDLGYFVPFTGLIPLDGSFEQTDISKLKMNGNFLEVKGFRSFCNLETSLFYDIDKFGIISENNYKETVLTVFPIQYEDSNYQTIENVNDDRFKVPIKLYTAPDTSSMKRLIILKSNSIIKYFDGYHNSDFWVHLRINGYEGYILWNDLYYLGFNECGM